MTVHALANSSITTRSTPVSSSLPAWRRACHLMAKILIPLLSLVAFIQNKIKTGHYFTTTRVFSLIPVSVEENVRFFESVWNLQEISETLKTLARDDAPFILGMHVETEKLVGHSTLLIFERSQTKGLISCLFFDVRGTPPDQANVRPSSLPCDWEENSTVFDIYTALALQSLPNTVMALPLTYSTEDNQPDRVRCTAYSAIVLDAFKKEWETNDNFSSNSFMQDFANGKYTRFFTTCALISRLTKPEETISPLPTAEQGLSNSNWDAWTVL